MILKETEEDLTSSHKFSFDLILAEMEVQVINNVGYIWNREDVRKLRDRHRILGSFVGFSPKTFNIGLPFISLPEEMQLLKEKRIIKLYQIDADKIMRPSIIER